MDGTPENFIQRVLKINTSTKSRVERLCDLKIYAVSVLSYIGSICAPDKATLKAEAHALQCTTAGPYNAIPTSLLGVGSVCGLGPDIVRIHSISLAARCRTAACSNTLNQGLEKIQDKKQKVATNLLCDKLHTQDFAGPISLRASKVPGPISRYRIADILPHMKLVSRASRPGLTVGFLRILSNGLCKAHRFHTEGDEQTCRVGCPNEPDALSLITTNALSCTECFFLEHATARPRRNHLLHDFITQVFLRNLQYGIVLMGFIYSFVYAHRQHRRCIDNPGNFGDCMKRKNPFHDTNHPCPRRRVPGNMPYKTHACNTASELSLAKAQSQISASFQRSYHNT